MISDKKAWAKGHKDGVRWVKKHYVIKDGIVKNGELPENFRHRASAWDCGFAEGLLSGRIQIEKSIKQKAQSRNRNERSGNGTS